MATCVTTYSSLTDRELSEMLLTGDQSAYTEIFERYHELLLKHAYQLLQDKNEALDLVQDVFLSLWQKRETLVFSTSLSAYIYTATRNRVFNRLSHQKVVGRYAESLSCFMEKSQPIADEQMIGKELAFLIEKEIHNLPSKMREIFLLRRKEELSYNEIAERLGISGKTAKLQVHNALKILRVKISSYLHAFVLF
ncbi:RNA polymerase sigma-70 factor [Pedobacter psychrodurus]|uniref:RNA polymerase sigma factor n=1 Tax=Pedobacter psychrodurus TaxID=2530456 RepID=UPI0029313C8F|nr:RNA polymerase sigma-70 factor [Pedobacter psychrodurus]